MSDDNDRPPHDLGGLEGGPIDREEHEPTFWEQRVDALMVLLAGRKLLDTAELRRGIESLGPEAYSGLGYYERWAASMAAIMVEKNVVSRAELVRRIEEIKARAKPCRRASPPATACASTTAIPERTTACRVTCAAASA